LPNLIYRTSYAIGGELVLCRYRIQRTVSGSCYCRRQQRRLRRMSYFINTSLSSSSSSGFLV